MKKPATDSTTPVMKAVTTLPPGWNHRVRTTSRTAIASEPHFVMPMKASKVVSCSRISCEPRT